MHFWGGRFRHHRCLVAKRSPRQPRRLPRRPQEVKEAPKRLHDGHFWASFRLSQNSRKISTGGVGFGPILGDSCRPRGGPLGGPGAARGVHPDCEKSRFSARLALERPSLPEPILSNFGLFWAPFRFSDPKIAKIDYKLRAVQGGPGGQILENLQSDLPRAPKV